ncbi:MAG: hypothetical protein GY854_34175 [Deltaproteobacteria bacterium]|nr:hypothetical protein [Deltaproteobacteria bacterium]
MGKDKILDIAHISFLDMLRVSIQQIGPAATKGTLMRNTASVADKFDPIDFPSMDDFVASIENVGNPVTKIEGKAVHAGDGLFGLPNCPFGESISNYIEVFGNLPSEYAGFTEEYNRSGGITDKHRVGQGAGVSPFCSIHQPLRSMIANQITIGGKPIIIYQLGCKSGSGARGFAEKYIEETGISKDAVDKILDDNMCCYIVKIQD